MKKRPGQRRHRRKAFQGNYRGSWGHEEIAAFALAFLAHMANRLSGGNFSVKIAKTEQEDRVEKTDIYLSNGSDVLRIDLTRSPAKLRQKYARSCWSEKNGGEWVKPMLITSREVIGLPYLCLGRALPAAFATGEFTTVEKACPTHGNSCDLAIRMYRLGKKLNRSLGDRRSREFQMPLPADSVALR